ncbi:hypothetical protein C8R43DRAFT_933173 [Mycena crocata]|nr:hypothetical protein C8R43DRAFT_933173 [Mycena crocata]
MVEYTPLLSAVPEDEAEEEIQFRHLTKAHSLRYIPLLTVLMALLAICAAGAFHLSVLSEVDLEALLSPNEIESRLRMAQPSPNLEKGLDTMLKKKMKLPQMVFPKYIVRANAAFPNKIYESGSSVVLSATDSMIYHWRTKSKWPTCYIAGWVSPSAELVAGNKSYTSEGDVTSIQIWNLTAPANRDMLKIMSWNTRPARLSLLGTVNFTSIEIQRRIVDLDGHELRPPAPRFDCLGVTEMTVEVVCTTCRLEFQQVFSDPALGFEFMQLA